MSTSVTSSGTASPARALSKLWIPIVLTIAAALHPIGGGVAFVALLSIVVWLYPRQATATAAILGYPARIVLDAFQDAKFLDLNPASMFGAVMIVVGGVAALRRLSLGQRLFPDALFGRVQTVSLMLYTLLFFVGAAAFGGLGFSTGGRELVRLVSAMSAGMLIVWWCDEDVPHRTAQAFTLLVVGSIVPLTVGAYQWITDTGSHEDTGYSRLFATFTHPQSFGAFLVPLVLVGIAGIIRLRGTARVFAAAFTAVTLTELMLTYSRTFLLALVAAVVVFVMPRRRQSLGQTMALLFGTAFFALIGWFVFRDALIERFRDIALDPAEIHDAVANGSTNSFQWRIINWTILTQLGTTRAWFGHGLGMTTVLNPLISKVSNKPYNAHNDFVRFFFEGGLVGLGIYVAYIGMFATWMRKTAATVRPPANIEANAIAAALLSLFVLSLGTTEMVENTAIIYEIFLLTGLLSGLRRAPEAETPEVVVGTPPALRPA